MSHTHIITHRVKHAGDIGHDHSHGVHAHAKRQEEEMESHGHDVETTVETMEEHHKSAHMTGGTGGAASE